MDSLEERLREALAPRYVLLRPVGKGGMGAVYLAREPELGRLVAVKVLAPELSKDDTARARFIREAQAAASIAHPNVIAIHSVGALDDGTPYFVMQYATGESIAARIAREGPVGSAEAARMIGELASALAAAHARGIVHRDVKPANVLYDQESGRVLITDFGIAAVRATPGAAPVPQLTGTGMMLGTPQYMSPEQLTAEPANDRTDVYGLGLVAYELLTGEGPFDVSSPMQLMAAHLRDSPRRLSERRPDVDPDLEELVLSCLAKDPAARPSAVDIVRRLGAADVVLEWPPPGLAPLQGALASIARLFVAGGIITVGAFIALFDSGSGLASMSVSSFLVLLIVAAAVGITVLGAGLWRLWRVATRMTAAIGLGYGWTTIAETLADGRHDTGVLIAGLREYSSLTAAERDRLRRRRVRAAIATLFAGISPVLLIVVFMWIAPRGSAPLWLAPLVAFGPLVALIAWSLDLRRREAMRVRPSRARIAQRRAPTDIADSLVHAWQRTFDAARSGQSLATGAHGHTLVARGAAVGLAGATIGTVVCLIPLFYIGVVGASLWPHMVNYGNVTAKSSVVETARPLALRPDPSITPFDAGRAMYLLEFPAGAHPDQGEGFVLRDAVGPPPLYPPEYPASLFTRTLRRPDGTLLDVRNGQLKGAPGPDGILAYAKSGFNPEERKWLEQLDASPRWRLWRQLARAQRADLIGARFIMPFADTLSLWSMPIPRLAALKAMAYASIDRAALYRSRGESARADSALRETISAGFRIADDGTTLIEQLMGMVIVGIGQGAIHDAATLDGRPDGKEWEARRSAVAAYDTQSNDSLTPVASAELGARALRRRIMATVVSTHLPRGTRVSNYWALAMTPCTNVQELVAGSDDDVRTTLKRGRAALARFPSESQVFDVFELQPTVVYHPHPPTRTWRVLMPMARLSGWLLRNPRIPGCVSSLASELF